MEVFKAKVKTVNWYTTFIGTVKPCIVLNETYTKKGYDFDGVALPNAASLTKYPIRKDDKVLLKVSKKGGISIKGVKYDPDNQNPLLELPKECPTCSSELLNYKDTELLCSNDYCPSKSRTGVLKAVGYATDDKYDVSDYYKFINSFYAKNSKEGEQVNNLFELLHYMSEFKNNEDSQTKENFFKTVFPEESDKFQSIYDDCWKYFTNEIKQEQVWNIISVKGITDKNIQLLSENFNIYTDGDDEFKKLYKLEDLSDDIRLNLQTIRDRALVPFINMHKQLMLSVK